MDILLVKQILTVYYHPNQAASYASKIYKLNKLSDNNYQKSHNYHPQVFVYI